MKTRKIKILITGGAGFIGSNLVEHFLNKGYLVVCLDNLSTGFLKNIENFVGNSAFTFIEGDIRDTEICRKAVRGCQYVLHHAALGSVPRSIEDPANTNSVNIDGFMNMLIAARDENVNRFIYAASSSTYGDSENLPKVEHIIGKPISPYAVTKYVNELYADVFSRIYGMECIGLRYFNVFGKNQSPAGAYAAVIPLWVKALIDHQSPIINGDGSFSRDFTYIENVIHANERALFTSSKKLIEPGKDYIHQVFNIAFGEKTKLIELFNTLKENLAKEDPEIYKIEPIIGPQRVGDIPHSLANIAKARTILGYEPKFNAQKGFEMACKWYYENLKS